jgi:signal transduction histidine kinase
MLPSEEFITLCQVQVSVLIEQLQVDWSTVYLTEGLDGKTDPQLLRVFDYPGSHSHGGGLKTLPQLGQGQDWDLQEWDGDKQVILPLIYQEEMMGLLVAGRENLTWQQTELLEMEKVAQTLAIARLMDQKQEYERLKNLLLHDRLDNLLHQLRNPLTALRTFGKLLLKRLGGGETPTQMVVDGILRESDRLKELLEVFEEEQTAEVPSLDGAKTPLALPGAAIELEALDLREIIEPLILSAQAIAQERQLELTADLPPTAPLVLANGKALREVISNLIDNALKYTPEGGRIKIYLQGNVLKLRQGIVIEDTGYGIPPEDQEHLFERHYRGIQAVGKIPGTGLGLAIAKALVGQMQGTIELISPNPHCSDSHLRGTIFIIWLSAVV